MERNNTSSQAHKLDVYSWTYIINGYGSAYKRTYRHFAKLSKSTGFWHMLPWKDGATAPPSENWRRESNKFNSKMKKIYDRGKEQCIPAFTKCVLS